MKYLLSLILLLSIACSDNDPSMECRPTKTIITNTSGTTTTDFSYNSSGNLERELVTWNGRVVTELVYHFDASGRLAKIIVNDNEYLTYNFNSDGKLVSIERYLANGTIKETKFYAWTDNILSIFTTKPGKPNFTEVAEIEFLDENIVRKTLSGYTGTEPNDLTSFQENRYEDFDSSPSHLYLMRSTRPGYQVEHSKNNHRTQKGTNANFNLDGSIMVEGTTSSSYVYTYNSSKAVTKAVYTYGTFIVTSELTYDHCK